jgi:hypothetical protein
MGEKSEVGERITNDCQLVLVKKDERTKYTDCLNALMNYRILRLEEIVDSLIIIISKIIHLAVLLSRKNALFFFGPLQQVTYRLPTVVVVTCMNIEQSCFLFFFTRILKQKITTILASPTAYVLFYYNSQDTGHCFPLRQEKSKRMSLEALIRLANN